MKHLSLRVPAPCGGAVIASIARAVGYASRSLQEGGKPSLPDVHASGEVK